MLTECPHCLSVLKVNRELVYASDPRVRCGECLHVFSALEHLTKAHTDLDTTKIYQPPKQKTAKPNEKVLLEADAEDVQSTAEAPFKPKKRPLRSIPAQQPAERPRRAAIPSLPTKDQAAIGRRGAATPAPRPSTPAAETDDRPTQMHTRHASVLGRSPVTGYRLPFHSGTIAAFLLLAALVALAVKSGYHTVASSSLSDRLSNAWCNISHCETGTVRDFSQLEVLRRKIYSHPNIEGQLVISLAMVNRLQSTMEYPTLLVYLTDISGATIARGRFKPSVYAAHFQPGMTLEPEQVLDVILHIKDPGKAAQSFNLEFQ